MSDTVYLKIVVEKNLKKLSSKKLMHHTYDIYVCVLCMFVC